MKSGLYSVISLLLLGIILGAALTNALIGSQLDHLTLANRSLQSELAEARLELQKLQESSKIKTRHTVASVETHLLLDSRDDLTDYDRMTAEFETDMKVKGWLNPIIGKEVSGLDSLLIPGMLDSREIEANGNKYRLRTYLVVVNRKTTVYIKATLLKRDGKIN